MIDIFSERREEDIGITLTDKIKDEFYYDFASLKSHNSFSDGLFEEERLELETIDNDTRATVFLFSRFLQNHCQDMLSGDFLRSDQAIPVSYN